MANRIDIMFTENDYKKFKAMVDKNTCDLNNVAAGAKVGCVWAELVAIKDAWDYGNKQLSDDLRNKEYTKIEINTYILGKDGGYDTRIHNNTGEVIPYDISDGEWLDIKATYSDTVESLKNTLRHMIYANPELLSAAQRKDLSWDEVA